MTGPSLRISAGTLRGRRLRVPAGVRPTASGLRESLFDVWAQRLAGSSFLDLFAGSGAVGLEALSRGAARLVLVESEPAVLRALRANCALAPSGTCRVERRRLPEELPAVGVPAAGFDLAFADPPYAFEAFEALLIALAPLLSPGGEAAIEHPRGARLPAAVPGLRLRARHGRGASRLTFFRPEGTGGLH